MNTNIVTICVLLGVFVLQEGKFIISKIESIQVDPLQMVEFNVISNKLNIEERVSLVPTKTFLANENLPVWLNTPDDPTALESINVMKNLGPFTVYRDPNTCTAALYFHNKQQFEGTIGHHHIIRNLRYNPTTNEVDVSVRTVYESPLEKHGNRLEENIKPYVREAGTTYHNTVKSLLEYPEVVYIETLVIVDYDITENFKHDYGAVVTYILTLFNTVDMLYSSIKIPNIKINIAGILITPDINSLPSFEVCRTKVQDQSWLNVQCVNHKIRNKLYDYRSISYQSYDIVVFLTSAFIYNAKTLKTEHLTNGITFQLRNNHGFKRTFLDVGIAIISMPERFMNFPTVAHEVAHLLGVPHDGGLLWRKDGTCKAHLMKKDQSLCFQCLRFGGNSPRKFQEFFGTRGACIFRNKPRSLEVSPNPQLFWTIDDQCKCYGYSFTLNPKKSLLASRFVPSAVKCEEILKCVDENRESHDTTYYMNGTPCGKKRFCWDKQCLRVREDDDEDQEDERVVKRIRINENEQQNIHEKLMEYYHHH